MATSPTAKEVSVDLAGFKSSVDQQFKHVDTKIDAAQRAIDGQLSLILRAIAALFTLIPMIIGGGFLLRSDLNEVKVELGRTGEKITALGDRISVLGDDVGRIRTAQKPDPEAVADRAQITFALRRIENKLNGNAPITLTEDEKNLVRSFLKIAGPPKGKGQYKVGDLINPSIDLGVFRRAVLVPDDLANKAPVLSGLRLSVDPVNGSALVIAADNHIVAIVDSA
jgi:hypothetical protein